MNKKFTLSVLFQILFSSLFAQCDTDKEYSSEYFHSSYFSFMPANVDRIEDSNGDFHELFFIDDSVSINEKTFNAGKNNLFFTSGVLIRKISPNGETIYKTLNFIKSSHPPLITPSRSSSNHLTLKNDSLCLFGVIEPGNYLTKKGNISLNFKIFAKITFDPVDGEIYEISSLISGIDNNLSISFSSLPMVIKDNILTFSFGTNRNVYDNVSREAISIEENMHHLILGSYQINNNSMTVEILGKSNKRISPYTISKNQSIINVAGIYTDSLYLSNGSILIPEKDSLVNTSTDGFLISLDTQLSIRNYLSIQGPGEFNNIFNQTNVTGDFSVFLNAFSKNKKISTKNYDSLISTSWNSFLLFDRDFNLKAQRNINAIYNTKNDYLHVNMFKMDEEVIVLSITTNSNKIIYERDTLASLHQTNNGYTLFHIYIDKNGNRIKHQTYYSEGFFTLYPLLNEDKFTYFNGTQIKDIKGSYEIPFPNNAPFTFLTFMKNVCTDKLLHTPKTKKVASSKIYPNPTHTSITIENESNISSIQMVDLMGKVVYQNESVNETAFTVDVSQFTNGLYVIKYFSDGKWNVGKVVKE